MKHTIAKQTVAALVTAGVVLIAIAPALATQYDTCQTLTRQNLATCVIKNSQERGGE